MALPLAALAALAPALAAAAASNPSRTMTIKNSCSAKAYIKPVSGSAGDCSAGCPDGSTCDSTTALCFWNNQTPSLGDYSVPAGSSSVITYPSITGNTTWSGNYVFALEGDTSSDDATCAASGCAPSGPFNQAEFTLLYNGVDWYDISNIGGFNVPMSITPANMTTGANAYTCGDTGSPAPQQAGLGASSWKASPPSDDYNYVTGGSGSTCTASSDCSSGESCGNVYANGTWAMVCGTLAGYWTENSICAYGVDAGNISCTSTVDNGSAGSTTLGAIQGCSGTSGSCYASGADTACCGGTDWSGLGDLIVNGTTAPVNTNPVWMSDVLPTIQWLKAMAPNAYTFPYDDVSSTFTCEALNSDGLNAQAYTIELCPGSTSVASKRSELPAAPLRRERSQRPAGVRRQSGVRRL